MNVNHMKNYHLIKAFINGFLDKRTGPYKSLKAVDTLCREAIEKTLSQNSDINNLIIHNNEQGIWIKDLIVNYTLLKMHHHALLWEIDEHKPQLQESLHD
ncbi:MAG: hypothetical protein K2P93_04565 [Alphaproteobacteria bacterium]|nr:hypothetical protein [Alphaproteobacteria bacterium]